MYATIRTGRSGYSAADVTADAITIAALIEQLQELIEDGVDPDTKVITVSAGFGAVYEPVTGVYEEDED